VDLGLDPAGVVWLDIALPARSYTTGAARAAALGAVVERTGAVPGVTAAAFIAGRPLGGGNVVTSVAAEGRVPPADEQPLRVPLHVVSPGYFDTLAIPRLDGRDFVGADTAQSPAVAIVSRSFAERLWPGERAVGRRLWMGRIAADAPLTTVVGVVDDVRHYGVSEPGQPMLYRPLAQMPFGRGSLLVRHAGASGVMLQTLRRTVWTVDGTVPLDRYGTMPELVRAALGEPRLGTVLFGTFSAMAVAFASVGLYATLAWIVRSRRRELGIRLALGAGAGDVRRLVVGQGVRLAALGIALGLAAAALASRLLTTLVYGVSPWDVPTFAATSALMALVAALACWIPAHRAARLDPVETLREG
jgi:putative ABC transport system permease protein